MWRALNGRENRRDKGEVRVGERHIAADTAMTGCHCLEDTGI